jgi:hypothetical protein
VLSPAQGNTKSPGGPRPPRRRASAGTANPLTSRVTVPTASAEGVSSTRLRLATIAVDGSSSSTPSSSLSGRFSDMLHTTPACNGAGPCCLCEMWYVQCVPKWSMLTFFQTVRSMPLSRHSTPDRREAAYVEGKRDMASTEATEPVGLAKLLFGAKLSERGPDGDSLAEREGLLQLYSELREALAAVDASSADCSVRWRERGSLPPRAALTARARTCRWSMTRRRGRPAGKRASSSWRACSSRRSKRARARACRLVCPFRALWARPTPSQCTPGVPALARATSAASAHARCRR